MTKAQRKAAAQKAVLTRQAREAFRRAYGEESFEAVRMLSQGKTTRDVSYELGIPLTSAAAYAANLTRETYWPLVVSCRF